MKKQPIILLVLSFLAVLFISSCNTSHISPTAITTSLGTTGCQTGPVAYTGGVPYTYTGVSGGVINSQAEYSADYHGFAPAGAPTPTPVPVDFTKNTLIIQTIRWDCGTGTGLTGITTDCNAIYLNMASSTNCSMYTCNSMFSFTASYLIDKTSLPVMIKNDTTQCDGSVTSYVYPLQ